MSDVGAKIFYEDIPIHKDIEDLSHGDDFELCFTASKEHSSKFKKNGYFCIGEILDGDKLTLIRDNNVIELDSDGWDSFK